MKREHFLKRWLPAIVLVIAVAIAAALTLGQEEPERTAGEPGALVETQRFERTKQRISIAAAGEVRPSVQTALAPQVPGRVVWIHPDLVPGGRLPAQQTVLRLEESDFELRVRQQRTALDQAEAELELEQGRQLVAKREWEIFADELAPAQRDAALALREPQLAMAKARVASAQAALAEAQLALGRTSIEAPFDAIVLSESVDLGQYVAPQSPVAQLVGAEVFWVQAAVPVAQLPFIDIDPSGGSLAHIRHDIGGRVVTRTGRVTRLLGDLEQTGRLARVLIEITNPEPRAGDASERVMPLLLSAWVDVRIEGNRWESGIALPRQYLHGDNEVWLFADGQLEIREVQVGWTTADAAFVTGGLSQDDLVVTSRIATPLDGMQLRRSQERNVAGGASASSG